MNIRPAKRALVIAPHRFEWNGEAGERCCGARVGGRACGLPEGNRHHQEPRRRHVDNDRQLRLDIDG